MLAGEYDLLYLITSELTNQREPKALFTRVVYRKGCYNYGLFNVPKMIIAIHEQNVRCRFYMVKSNQIRSTLHWCRSKKQEARNCSLIRLTSHTNKAFL